MLAKHGLATAALVGVDDDCLRGFMFPLFYAFMQGAFA
jgi:hypothetical protein